MPEKDKKLASHRHHEQSVATVANELQKELNFETEVVVLE